jgi:hypothetical protein
MHKLTHAWSLSPYLHSNQWRLLHISKTKRMDAWREKTIKIENERRN